MPQKILLAAVAGGNFRGHNFGRGRYQSRGFWQNRGNFNNYNPQKSNQPNNNVKQLVKPILLQLSVAAKRTNNHSGTGAATINHGTRKTKQLLSHLPFIDALVMPLVTRLVILINKLQYNM